MGSGGYNISYAYGKYGKEKKLKERLSYPAQRSKKEVTNSIGKLN